jgi:hypothetical protein
VLFAKQKKKLLEKLKLQRTKLSVKDQKEKLPVYIANPESIVGCAIHHKCKEDGEIAWFDARVLRVAILNEINPIKTEYIVHYDIEDDNTNNTIFSASGFNLLSSFWSFSFDSLVALFIDEISFKLCNKSSVCNLTLFPFTTFD